jgi:hypothetical protein
MTEPQEFTVRPTQPEDGAALNQLYHRLTGTMRSIAQWRWEWFDTPSGPAPSWVIVETASGRIVGHHGVVPVPLVCGGRCLAAARTENTMIDPDVRRRLVYPPVEARLLTELLKTFDLIYTTSGKGSHGLVRKRLGYVSAGTWRTFTVGLTPAYIAQRLAGRALGRLAAPLGFVSSRARAGWRIEETTDLIRIAQCCAGWHDAGAITADRTPDYVRWRLAEHPYHPIRLGLLIRDKKPVAFVAWREDQGANGTHEIKIEDICASDSDGEIFDAVFHALINLYRSKPARVTLRILDNDRPLARAALKAARLRRNPDETELLVRSRVDTSSMAWDATMILAEGI